MISIALNAIFIITIIYYGRCRTKGVLCQFYYPAVVLKIIAGWSVGLIYLFYYPGGDTWNHFQNAKALSEFAFRSYDNFFSVYISGDYANVHGFVYDNQPRSAFFCKIIGLVNLLTGSNYWLTSIYFSLFSFSGLWFLARRLVLISGNKTWVSITLLFFPSLVFWSAGVMKESIAVGAMCFALGFVIDFMLNLRNKWAIVIFLLLLILLTFLVKYYYAALLGATVFALLLGHILLKKGNRWQFDFAVWLLLVMGSLFFFTWIHPNLSLNSIMEVIVGNYNAFMAKSDTQNVINYKNLEPNWTSFVIHSPKALFMGLFAPLTMFSASIFGFWVSLENWLLLLLTVSSIYFLKIPENKSDRLMLFAAITFIILMAILLALSTPNVGTLIRYKVGLMPVFLYLITVNQDKTIKKIREFR